MGFSWEPLDTVKASSVVEMKNAVNTLTDLKTAPRFNWQHSTPAAGDIITAGRYQELQSAADYADNRNVCLSDKAAYYTTYDTSEYSSNDGAEDSNQDVTNNVTIYTAYDIGYDAAKYDQVDNDQHATYNTARDIGYDAAKYVQVDNDQNVTYNATQDVGYDGALYTSNDANKDGSYNANRDITNYATKDITVHSGKQGTYYTNVCLSDCGNCFSGSSISILASGMPIRIDRIKVGDRIIGANGKANTVQGIEKSPSTTRTILCLDDMTTRFVGEHPFLMENGEWGAFNKELTDRGVALRKDTILESKGKQYKMLGGGRLHNDKSVTQITNGAFVKTVNGECLPINSFTTLEKEDFIYTVLMDGDRTWNVGGFITAGLAYLGDKIRLEEVA